MDNKNNSTFYRFIVCAVFIATWVLLITNLSSIKTLPRKDIKKISIKHYHTSPDYNSTKVKRKPAQKSIQENIEKKEKIDKKDNIKPNKTIAQEIKQKTKDKTIEDKKTENKKKLPQNNTEASNTKPKEVINNDTKQIEPSDIKLRKSIKIDIGNEPLAINTLNSEFQKSWIPAYINKKEELKYKTQQVTENLNNIVDNIAFVGLITNSNGSKVAIIKNHKTNEVKYLQTGDLYKSLTLTSISEDFVEFQSKNLNETFVKNLVLLEN